MKKISIEERERIVHEWEKAIDMELTSTHLWTEELARSPKKALHALERWNQGVGAYFAQERLNALENENKELKIEIEKLRSKKEVSNGNELLLP